MKVPQKDRHQKESWYFLVYHSRRVRVRVPNQSQHRHYLDMTPWTRPSTRELGTRTGKKSAVTGVIRLQIPQNFSDALGFPPLKIHQRGTLQGHAHAQEQQVFHQCVLIGHALHFASLDELAHSLDLCIESLLPIAMVGSVFGLLAFTQMALNLFLASTIATTCEAMPSTIFALILLILKVVCHPMDSSLQNRWLFALQTR